ncbi:glycosyl hydrolase [Niveomyces insectorum RCEF 264]|uniref:Glycosyl hydrolase n=1 Tax=Niveomyces insectorum RCEF 264 TaxID=1081102 RepID=A0A162LBJ7_9HYPO|nr:glycosyl hydrolase [Niveomyces insectorum RCEF 264]
MATIRVVGRRRSRLSLLVSFVFCFLILLPTSRHQISNALWFVLFPPASRLSSSSSPGQTFRDGLFGGSEAPSFDVIRYINPLIGTVNGGHVFPGATLPYGMAKAVADTRSPGENAGGYVSDLSEVTGFSHLHDSGTGGGPSMGNFPLFVHPGCPDDDYVQCEYMAFLRAVVRRNDSARASPGYFALDLNNSVSAEMTTTQHAALYRFSFPAAAAAETEHAAARTAAVDPATPIQLWAGERFVPYSPLVLVDLIDLANTRTSGGIQVYPDSGRIIGDGVYQPSFGMGEYSAFFCADFRGAAIRKAGVFAGKRVSDALFYINHLGSGVNNPTGSAGAWIQFAPPPDPHAGILVRVGLSFLSTDQACANAEAEVPDWDFDGTVLAAQDAWREKLAPIAVNATGVPVELQTTFWSGLYRSLLSPQNYTGENQKWTSAEPYFDSFYCIWDSFRAQHPLLTILDPPAQTQMVRALLDIYRFDGKLPDCRMSFCKGYTQGGSNADVVLADAFVKNLTDGIDWATAYEAVVSDAEVEPGLWAIEGRGGLESYHELGYVPWNDRDVNGTGPMSRTISRSVEYAYDDFAISVLAAGLQQQAGLFTDVDGGDGGGSSSSSNKKAGPAATTTSSAAADQLTTARLEADAAKYHARGANWRKLWNAEQKDLYRDAQNEIVPGEFVGFLQPRLLNGTWRYHNTRRCSPGFEMDSCYFDTAYETYEGSPWLYSFYAPQDMRTLVAFMGGPAAFVRRLAYFHETGIAYMGNEPTFLPVFQFHYANRPGLSAYWVHRYIPAQFNASVNGIPGNDDCAMGAFAAFALMGFFPVAGQNVYLLTAPFFPEVRVRAKNGRADAVFRVRNFDPTYAAIYIQSATLDGRPYTKNWITHDIFLEGGVLEFEVGPHESTTWGTRDEDLPPSYYP